MQAWGAVTILNATATGTGCSLAIRDGCQATWEPAASFDFESSPATDGELAKAICQRLGVTARIWTQSAWPARRGLKTSSSAATAMLRAASRHAGPFTDAQILQHAVSASRAAGVTITGAYDDQVAVTLGGCHLTDNRASRILRVIPVAAWPVAVWVPDASISKKDAARVEVSGLRRDIQSLANRLTAASLGDVMTRNGALFTQAYQDAGLPVSARPAEVALAHGALGAGLSGCGPAVAAVFESPVVLPHVPGGSWRWSDVVP